MSGTLFALLYMQDIRDSIRQVNIEITATRRWEVTIGSGIIDRVGNYFDLQPYSSIALITDVATGRLYGERAISALEKGGKKVELLTVPRGEKSKSLPDVERGYRFLMERGFDRKSLLCILGGGVTGDLGGYIAATYLRGIDYIQLPTTLLAQVDSSLGGKVGVNFGGKKNIIGAFYQPRAIISDVSLLATLPPLEVRNGMAEIIKYGVAMDGQLFANLEDRPDSDLTGAELIEIVERCSRLKLDIVERDETERTGVRAILNFGHTLGHAIEAASGLEGRHGEAVAVGIAAAARLSERMGMLDKASVGRIEKLLTRYDLPVRRSGLKPERLLNAMRFDKKVDHGQVRWVLLDGLGHGVTNCSVEAALLNEVLAELCA